MTALLHVSASPRGAQSESLAIAEEFLTAYRDVCPDDAVEHWDLWDGSLPQFGPVAAAAKMAVFAGAPLTSVQAAAWEEVKATFTRFNATDRYLFSVPMWNASVPYVLKSAVRPPVSSSPPKASA